MYLTKGIVFIGRTEGSTVKVMVLLKEVLIKLKEIEKKIDSTRTTVVKPIGNQPVSIDNFEYTPGSLFIQDKPVLKNIDLNVIGRFTNIIGLDSSSRYINTPYFFIAVASASAINRFNSFIVDSPNIDYALKTGSPERYLLIAPEFDGLEADLTAIEKLNVIVKNPAGAFYSPFYSRNVLLDELRLMHENIVLKKLLESDIRDSYLLIDGPVYYTPPVAYHYVDRRVIGNELLRLYIESWSIIVSERVRILEKLIKDKNIKPIGIVKRLNKSNMLCRIDPFNVSQSWMNDYAYLSIVTNRFKPEVGKVIYFGTIRYRPENLPIHLPDKYVAYIGVPKLSYNVRFINYVFYRVESIYELDSIDPVLYDSVVSGSTLPISILVADNRVKKTSFMLIKYVASSLEIPLDHVLEFSNL